VIVLPAWLTKTGEARKIPITPRLDAILRMRRHDPAGEEHKPTAHVLATNSGVGSSRSRHRGAPRSRKSGIAELRFHDLRREAASTLFERGLALNHVSKLLGHGRRDDRDLPEHGGLRPPQGVRRHGAAGARGGGVAGGAEMEVEGSLRHSRPPEPARISATVN